MATDDLDPDDTPIPAPDAEPSKAERGRARSFADLIDRAVAGRGQPAAMSADDRSLLEVATVIRAASGHGELAASRRQALIEQALSTGIERALRGSSTQLPASRARSEASAAAAGGGKGVGGTVVAIGSRSRARWLPWSVTATAVAAAAAVFLIWGPLRSAPVPAAPPVAIAAPPLPTHLRSRPADALVGLIPRERAGDARARIDAIYADRLAGWRELSMGGRRPAPGGHR